MVVIVDLLGSFIGCSKSVAPVDKVEVGILLLDVVVVNVVKEEEEVDPRI